MTKARVEVVTSVERRRHWTTMEKEQLIAATREPGASVSAVARQAGMHPSQLYGWRRQLCARGADSDHGCGRRGDGDGSGRSASQ
jgi:transposase